MDCNKQRHKISLLNQEIGKLKECLGSRAGEITCLEQNLEDTAADHDEVMMKLREYEDRMNVLMEQNTHLEASAKKQKELQRDEIDKKVEGLRDQLTQTPSPPLKARIIIQRATSAFKEALQSLSARHPAVHREFFSAVLLSLLESSEVVRIPDPTAPEETADDRMKRFISSLKIDVSSDSKREPPVTEQNHKEQIPSTVISHETKEATVCESGPDDGYCTYGHPSPRSGQSESERTGWKREEDIWSAVEDPHVIYDVRIAEKSSVWKDIEAHMGLNHDDITLMIEFRDTEEAESRDLDQPLPLPKDHHLHHKDPALPPLPTSSPPPLTPEPSLKDGPESADEASDIDDEDDGAVPCLDSVAPNWTLDRVSSKTDRSSSAGPVRPQPVPARLATIKPDGCYPRAKSVDRDLDFSEKSQPMDPSLYPSQHHAVGGSLESIPDSGLESMKQGISATEKTTTSLKQRTSVKCTTTSVNTKTFALDQSTQTKFDERSEKEENRSDVFIIFRTQLEQREKELNAKSNEVDRLSQEMRRWQQDAVAAGEEKARLSALLNCALRDLKSSQGEKSQMDPLSTANKTTKAPYRGYTWDTSPVLDKTKPVSQIPVSLSRNSSAGDKDFSKRLSASDSPIIRRTASLYSSSSSSTDGAVNSEPGSNFASPSQDRKTPPSYLPRPIKDYSSHYLPSGGLSARKEADRLFKQSFDSPRNSVMHSALPTVSTTSAAVDDALSPLPLQAVDAATSRTEGATLF